MRVILSILRVLAFVTAGCGTASKKQSLKVGARGFYIVPVHASVGKWATAASSDEAIVRIVDTQTRYLRPERMKPGFTGGDAAQHTFVFEGIAPGTATVTVTKLFRDKVEETVKIKVTVVK